MIQPLRHIISIIMILAPVLVHAEKVALITESQGFDNVADMVLAEMSSSPGIEFLERRQIGIALKERKLKTYGLTVSDLSKINKPLHADLFAVLTAGVERKKTILTGLIVYDSKNGMQLVNKAISAENAVNDISVGILKAVNYVRKPNKFIPIAIEAVRNAGVPESQRYRLAGIAAELERQLSTLPDVIILERDHLAEVNTERKLTGQQYALMPSTRLIRLEFSPGSSPKILNLSMRLTDAVGKTLDTFSVKYNAANPKAIYPKLTKKILEDLKIKANVSTITSCQDEAKRFYAEYRFLLRTDSFSAARQKLNAAMALNPLSLAYRKAELTLNKKESKNKKIKTIIAAYESNLNLIENIKRDFHISTDDLYSFDYLNIPSGDYSQMRETDLTKLKKLSNRFRPHHNRRCREKYYKFDLSNGINSTKEWNNYLRYISESTRYYLYWDAEKWSKESYNSALESLELAKAYHKKNPEFSARGIGDWLLELSVTYRSFSCPDHLQQSYIGKQFTSFIEQLILNSDQYINEASSLPFPSAKLSAIQLKLIKNTIASNYHIDILRKNMNEYCREKAEIVKRLPGKKNREVIFAIFWDHRNDLRKVIYEIKTEHLEVSQKSQEIIAGKEINTPKIPISDLNNLITKEKKGEARVSMALKLEPQWRKYVSERFTDPEVSDFFKGLCAMAQSRSYTKNSVYEQFRNVINRDIQIERLLTLDNNSEKPSICNAIISGDNLYLLMTRKKWLSKQRTSRYSWTLAGFNLKTRKLTMPFPWTESDRFRSRGPIPLRILAIENNLAIAETKDYLTVYHLDSGKTTAIKDLPGDTIFAATIMKERIYVFSGGYRRGRTAATMTVLMSLKPDGTDRKVHISCMSDNPTNDLDRAKPFLVYSMVADTPRKRLVFLCESPNRSGKINGLWEFQPETKQCRLLFEQKHQMIDRIMIRNKEKLFFSFFHERFCEYDLSKDKGEVIFSYNDKTGKYYLPVKFRSCNGIVYRGPFFARSNQLWLGGEYPQMRLLQFPNITDSPLVAIEQSVFTMGFYNIPLPYPDGKSALSIGPRSIIKITPKPSSAREKR